MESEKGLRARSTLMQGKKTASELPPCTHTCSWVRARSQLGQLARQGTNRDVEDMHSVVPLVMGQVWPDCSHPFQPMNTGPMCEVWLAGGEGVGTVTC